MIELMQITPYCLGFFLLACFAGWIGQAVTQEEQWTN